MFWRGFLNSDPSITFTTAAATGRKKILPQNPLSNSSGSLDFAFQNVGYRAGHGHLRVRTGLSATHLRRACHMATHPPIPIPPLRSHSRQAYDEPMITGNPEPGPTPEQQGRPPKHITVPVFQEQLRYLSPPLPFGRSATRHRRMNRKTFRTEMTAEESLLTLGTHS